MIMRIDLTTGSRSVAQIEELESWPEALEVFLDTMRGMGYIFNFNNDEASEALWALGKEDEHE
jgi:hypothetical protein